MMDRMKSMFNKFVLDSEQEADLSDETKAFIENVKKYDFIRLCIPDLNGIHLSKMLSTRFAKKVAMGQSEIYSGSIGFGPRFEMINIPEVIKRKHINSVLKPDFSTLHSCNWISQRNYAHSMRDIKLNSISEHERGKYSFCSVLCDVYWPNNEPMFAYPRFVAHSLIKELEDKYNLRLYSAFEPEFRAFVKGSCEASCLKPMSANVSQCGNLKKPIPYTNFKDMYRTSLLSVYENYFADIDYNMQLSGIDVQDYSNEDGEGQLECPLMPTWGLSAADNYFILKQAVKEIGSKHDMEISFMTTPLLNCTSSGCHYNHSLWYADTNRNAFYDDKDKSGLVVF
ncbi:Glutamine synthetase [Schistosoma japonicum]|nr:Glutamine synthetase [Schistosoma japonicum]